MPSKQTRWPLAGACRPFVLAEFESDIPAPAEVVGEIVGCHVKAAPLAEKYPLCEINQVFEPIRSGALKRRADRGINFIALRRALAANAPWSDEPPQSIQPRARLCA